MHLASILSSPAHCFSLVEVYSPVTLAIFIALLVALLGPHALVKPGLPSCCHSCLPSVDSPKTRVIGEIR